MFPPSISILLLVLQLFPPWAATMNTSCSHLSSILNTDAILYNIPQSNPPITLSITSVKPPQLNPSIVLLSIVEHMQPVCRFWVTAFPSAKVFEYRLIRVRIETITTTCGRVLTYNDACTVLRGLSEFMVNFNQFYQFKFVIWVNGNALGGGQLNGIEPTASVADIDSS